MCPSIPEVFFFLLILLLFLGATSASGTDVANRPVPVADLFCTFCHALGINPRKKNLTPIGRRIKIVGGAVVRELFAYVAV